MQKNSTTRQRPGELFHFFLNAFSVKGPLKWRGQPPTTPWYVSDEEKSSRHSMNEIHT